MLKKLRFKFILINMLLAALVLVTTFGGVCYMSYSSSLVSLYSQLNSVLSRVASSMIPQIEEVQPITAMEAIDPDDLPVIEPPERPTTANSDSDVDSDGTVASKTDISAYIYRTDAKLRESSPEGRSVSDFIAAPNIGGASTNFFSYGSEALYAVYAVTDQGICTALPDFSVASINESILLTANDIVMASVESIGSLPELGLVFERMLMDDGSVIAYADASRLNNWKELALMLAVVGIMALAIFYLINILFSRWALRPVKESIRQQREVLRQQQQFTADASHELKTPLTIILANMSILKSHPDSDVATEMQWIESTETEAERMQLLVADMLDLARSERDRAARSKGGGNAAGKKGKNGKAVGVPGQSNLPDTWKDIDFSDLVEGEVLQFESVAFDRGVTISSRIQEGLQVKGDPERLGRMVATLVDNACKYTEEGGEVTVRLFSRSRGNDKAGDMDESAVAKLTVHNSGTPIAKEDLPHLFDRFYRADKARTSGKGGYGLGLAIGREIARDHGGNITVHSSAPDGTTFTVSIPLCATDPASSS